MIKLIVLLIIALLVREGQSLGSSCGGKELGHSRQTQHWLAAVKRQGTAATNADPYYKVFRNVKEFGAKGDGVTDDTAAINAAISQGVRCGTTCPSSTLSPALVYFPAGKYLVSAPLMQYYYTQFVGDAIDLPVLVMSANFSADFRTGLITSDAMRGDQEVWQDQNNFYRQIRNFVIDLTGGPANKDVSAIHWQVAQATSITNVHVKMRKGTQSKQYGIWMDNGSGGFMSDLTFDGGAFGLWVGNQQFTTRNLTITNADTAIFINWVWEWTFKGIRIENCKTGLDITGNLDPNINVGSVVLMDADIINTEVAVKTNTKENAKTNGTLILDNVRLQNVQKGVLHTNGQVLLAGANQVVQSWGQGHFYQRDGQHSFKQGTLPAPSKSSVLLDNNGKFFEKSKPSYTDVALADFVSVKDEGAKGDGHTDDTRAIQSAIEKYAGCKVIFFPSGHYIVTDTIYVPPGSRIIGEMWSTILAKGNNFADQNNPRPVFQVGKANEQGVAEISEMIFSSQGPVPGAIIIQINMKESEKGSVGLWDVHFRIGGAKGTELQADKCKKGGPVGRAECFGAYLLLHIAQTGSAYLENVWAWVADHDIDLQDQITIYNARGVLIESREGPVWLYGTASEHSVLYQYNIANAKNVLMAMIQIETPYYQPNPPAPQPFSSVAKYSDPDYSHCAANDKLCPEAYGLRVLNSENVYVYGTGLYNFFIDYAKECEDLEHCQETMISVEKSDKNVYLYAVNTKAADTMIAVDGQPRVKQADNRNTYCSGIGALFP